MTRIRLLLCLLACIAFFAVGFILLSIRTGPRINQASFDLIQEGMTEAEVVQILRGPPGDYGPGEELPLVTVEISDRTTYRRWSADDFSINVAFDQGGRVFAKWPGTSTKRIAVPESLLGKLRRWYSTAFDN